MNEPIFLVIDLFCGAGGTTTGFAQAEIEGDSIAKVIACINHDAKAIESHWLNHPEVTHFEEDIRTLDLTNLIKLVTHYREIYPNAFLVLWASLECTNFSKAKGGLPRDADSRTLADHLHRYIESLQPEYMQIENVVEFMSWGPLDKNGKPISRKNGADWMKWRNSICERYGYYDQWTELNSANFGAYTSRNRLFGCFTKPCLPIIFPEPTHAKKPEKHSIFCDLKKWKAVKDVLNFADEGESIFTRKKELSDKTLERIYAGLVKYVAKGDTAFISKYFSGRPAGKVSSVNTPAGTVTTVGNQTLVQPISILKYNSTDKKGNHFPPSINEPSPVVTTQGRLGLVQGEFLAGYYGNGDNVSSVENPSPTLTTKDRLALIQSEFIVQRNSGEPESKLVDLEGPARTLTATGGNQDLVQPEFLVNYNHSSDCNDINEPSPTLLTRDKLALTQPEFFIDKHFGAAQNQSIEQPAGTILPCDKHRLVEVQPFVMNTNFDNKPTSIEDPAPVITANRKHHYLINPSWGGNPGSVDDPCCVVVARQDKAPLYFVQVEHGPVSIAVFESDSEIMIKIKQFMAVYGLVDIKMRMLRVHELLKIQGFPNDYKLAGNQSDQKKFIGNSVVPHVVKAWCEAMAKKLIGISTEAFNKVA
jgi:DNA (cytosine-5)-methyltransferase 1